MPTYPAFALLIGCAMAQDSSWIRGGAKVAAGIATLALIAIAGILGSVWNLPTPGDISSALTQNPDMYTLSLGHMGDLTIHSFAYLRIPLMIAGLACLVGAISAWRWRAVRYPCGLAAPPPPPPPPMMVLFLNAARIAMGTFDPYLSSQPLAEALKQAPKGRVVLGDQYYVFSSVFFYADLDQALLWNGALSESGVRVLCARSTQCVCERCPVVGAVAFERTRLLDRRRSQGSRRRADGRQGKPAFGSGQRRQILIHQSTPSPRSDVTYAAEYGLHRRASIPMRRRTCLCFIGASRTRCSMSKISSTKSS